jgi:hypothetical protein
MMILAIEKLLPSAPSCEFFNGKLPKFDLCALVHCGLQKPQHNLFVISFLLKVHLMSCRIALLLLLHQHVFVSDAAKSHFWLFFMFHTTLRMRASANTGLCARCLQNS